mmetsp:Transcript_32615/g.35105  ORF Transcript_32615/g.35105 Transcript_32615/m.35105 type:complete len:190 (+) Transcript_32615:19-588(+)
MYPSVMFNERTRTTNIKIKGTITLILFLMLVLTTTLMIKVMMIISILVLYLMIIQQMIRPCRRYWKHQQYCMKQQVTILKMTMIMTAITSTTITIRMTSRWVIKKEKKVLTRDRKHHKRTSSPSKPMSLKLELGLKNDNDIPQSLIVTPTSKSARYTHPLDEDADTRGFFDDDSFSALTTDIELMTVSP